MIRRHDDMILSIAIVTRNRCDQVREAIVSCLRCTLPEKTEFIVVDNASGNNTEETVKALFRDGKYSLIYRKSVRNLGAGGGRNACYALCSGKYIYAMDDDACISESNPGFFIDAVRMMDEYGEIAALATQIYDNAWKRNRQNVSGKEIHPGLYRTKMFCGGSHFLRSGFYKEPPYFSNEYGMEELPPSLEAYDCGCVVAFAPGLLALHNPQLDRWDGSENSMMYVIRNLASKYAVCIMMYPRFFRPLCHMAYTARIRKHLSSLKDAGKMSDELVEKSLREYRIEKRIRFMTVIRLFFYFGAGIF